MTYKNNDLSSCRKHPSYYSDELKQRLAASASQPGVSLSSLAQEQGVSVSALSRWRKQYHQPAAAPLIPIAVEPTEPLNSRELASGAESLAPPSGVIEVTLERAAIRINGLVDSHTVRVVLESLLGC